MRSAGITGPADAQDCWALLVIIDDAGLGQKQMLGLLGRAITWRLVLRPTESRAEDVHASFLDFVDRATWRDCPTIWWEILGIVTNCSGFPVALDYDTVLLFALLRETSQKSLLCPACLTVCFCIALFCLRCSSLSAATAGAPT